MNKKRIRPDECYNNGYSHTRDERNAYRAMPELMKMRVKRNPMMRGFIINTLFLILSLCCATAISAWQKNEEIPSLIVDGKADVMITEITEAPYYVQADARLAAPLLSEPFTHGEIGVLMRKGQEDLLQAVNNAIKKMKSDGTLRRLHEKYGLVYAY